MATDDQSPSIAPEKRARGKKLTTAEKRVAQELFLDSFRETANVRDAAKIAGVDRNTVYQWCKSSKVFKSAYDAALEDANDAIRSEIRRRAIDGWNEEVYQNGFCAGTVHKYSDTLLIFLTKARMPEFRDKQQVELTGKDGGPIQTEGLVIDTRTLSAEQLAILKDMATVLKEKEQ